MKTNSRGHPVGGRVRAGDRVRATLFIAAGVPMVALGVAPASAAPLGPQIQVSAQAPAGDPSVDAEEVAVAYDHAADQYAVVWQGDVAPGEDEVFIRILDREGRPVSGPRRISEMGTPGNTKAGARNPVVAYNSQNQEYLVVWEGTDDTGEEEVYGQRLTSAGTALGADDFQISDMGPAGDRRFEGDTPAVAYNSATNQYFVVWEGEDDAGALSSLESEIYGQRLAASGAEIGADDFRISTVGRDGDGSTDGVSPAVAYNSLQNEFLVVWEADEVHPEGEIYGQRIGASGAALGIDDFRISDAGSDGDPDVDSEDPAVAHLATTNEYLVVWEGEEDLPPLVPGEEEVFGQRLAGGSGAEVGVNDFRISDMGPDGVQAFGAAEPEVAANDRAAEFLVVWKGDDDTPPLVDSKFEVFGQRISAGGGEIGANDFRISVTETQANASVGVFDPTAVAFNSNRNEYLVGWEADSDVPPRVDGEQEVYVRRTAAGTATAAPAPLCAPRPAPASPSRKRTPALALRQLIINQRIYTAAIRRAAAINAWLDAGVEARDLCAGAFTASSLHSGITTAPVATPGANDPAAAPRPRPITPKRLSRRAGATFRLTTGQLRTNQRIAARAVRESNALKERLASKLSGGDLKDGTVTAGKLSTAITVTAATAAALPPAKTTTAVARATPKDDAVFALTAAQLAINQRIGQAAIRRLNDVRDELLSGLAAEDFKPGTVTAIDLAPGVAPVT